MTNEEREIRLDELTGVNMILSEEWRNVRNDNSEYASGFRAAIEIIYTKIGNRRSQVYNQGEPE